LDAFDGSGSLQLQFLTSSMDLSLERMGQRELKTQFFGTYAAYTAVAHGWIAQVLLIYTVQSLLLKQLNRDELIKRQMWLTRPWTWHSQDPVPHWNPVTAPIRQSIRGSEIIGTFRYQMEAQPLEPTTAGLTYMTLKCRLKQVFTGDLAKSYQVFDTFEYSGQQAVELFDMEVSGFLGSARPSHGQPLFTTALTSAYSVHFPSSGEDVRFPVASTWPGLAFPAGEYLSAWSMRLTRMQNDTIEIGFRMQAGGSATLQPIDAQVFIFTLPMISARGDAIEDAVEPTASSAPSVQPMQCPLVEDLVRLGYGEAPHTLLALATGCYEGEGLYDVPLLQDDKYYTLALHAGSVNWSLGLTPGSNTSLLIGAMQMACSLWKRRAADTPYFPKCLDNPREAVSWLDVRQARFEKAVELFRQVIAYAIALGSMDAAAADRLLVLLATAANCEFFWTEAPTTSKEWRDNCLVYTMWNGTETDPQMPPNYFAHLTNEIIMTCPPAQDMAKEHKWSSLVAKDAPRRIAVQSFPSATGVLYYLSESNYLSVRPGSGFNASPGRIKNPALQQVFDDRRSATLREQQSLYYSGQDYRTTAKALKKCPIPFDYVSKDNKVALSEKPIIELMCNGQVIPVPGYMATGLPAEQTIYYGRELTEIDDDVEWTWEEFAERVVPQALGMSSTDASIYFWQRMTEDDATRGDRRDLHNFVMNLWQTYEREGLPSVPGIEWVLDAYSGAVEGYGFVQAGQAHSVPRQSIFDFAFFRAFASGARSIGSLSAARRVARGIAARFSITRRIQPDLASLREAESGHELQVRASDQSETSTEPDGALHC